MEKERERQQQTKAFVSLDTDIQYMPVNWLSASQGISAVIFFSQTILALCQAMDVSYGTRNLWTIATVYVAAHGVVTFLMQTGSYLNYWWRLAHNMASSHNSDVAVAYFTSLINFVLIIAFQFNWLNTYTPTWMKDVIDISTGSAGEVRTYFSLQVVTMFLSFISLYTLVRALGAHLSPLKKIGVKKART